MFNSNRINIHELTIEEPEKQSELPFDPAEIFTESDLEKMGDLSTDDDLLERLSSLAILDKNKLPEITDETKKKIWDRIDAPLALDESSLSYLHLGRLAWATQISPDFLERSRVDKYINVTHIASSYPTMKYENESVLKKEPVLEQVVEFGREQLELFRNRDDWRHMFEIAAWLTVVGVRPKLSASDFQNFEQELKNEKQPYYLIEDAAAMSIIYPDYDLDIPREKWLEIKSFLEELNREKRPVEDWCMYSAMAKIVADKCAEVASRKSFKSTTPPLPETKKF